jgi:hypothetical protein
MNLNKEELVIGYVYGLISCFAIGALGILVACLTTFLWALTGSESKYNWKIWRRLVNPWILAMCFVIAHHSWIPLLSIPLSWGTMSLGYGISDSYSDDEGSWLGRKFGSWTRAVWFGLLALTMIPLFL